MMENITLKRPGITEVLKYTVVAVIIAYIVVLMAFTSGSTKSFKQVSKAVESALDTTDLQKTDSQGLKRYYGLNGADYEGVMLYTSKSSMSADEILLIEAKSDGQVEGIKAAIDERLAGRKNDFDGYAPKQEQLIEQAQVTVRGKYVFLAVSKKAESYKSAFSKSL